jgi:2-oxoglutarate dehydrogenase complex dehydrogenase (E1) component-like enzyme
VNSKDLIIFQNLNEEENWGNTGDVKYHLGTTHDKYYPEYDHTIKLVIK